MGCVVVFSQYHFIEKVPNVVYVKNDYFAHWQKKNHFDCVFNKYLFLSLVNILLNTYPNKNQSKAISNIFVSSIWCIQILYIYWIVFF